MSDIVYNNDSPYYETPQTSEFLDLLTYRAVPAEQDDVLYTLTSVHNNRPDLLAFDLYGNSNLWWVFIARNPNVFTDPVWDFVEGRKFYLPKQETLERVLGI